MIAFKVEIDDEMAMLAGVEDWSILALHVDASKAAKSEDNDEIWFSVGGLSSPDSEGVSHHFRWKRCDLKVGSRIVVTVVEAASADPPIKRFRSDATVQEDPFTEEESRELRRQDYLALKQEFEGTQAQPGVYGSLPTSPE